MLITFHCKDYEDITMFGDIAKQLLQMMGHSAQVPGAIKAQDLPQALEKLQQSLQQEMKPATDDEEDMPVSLKHRAIPIINMLKAAIKNNADILWDA